MIARGHSASPGNLQLGVSPRKQPPCWAPARSWAFRARHVTLDDVKAMVFEFELAVMLRPEAELEGATPDGVLDGILASVPVPASIREITPATPQGAIQLGIKVIGGVRLIMGGTPTRQWGERRR